MSEAYIFRNLNDSVNEIIKPFWFNDTICSLSNQITTETPWYEKMDLSTKIALISLGVSVLTFLLGFIVSEAIRRHNKSNELKQYKQFIEEWVDKSNTSLNQYIKSLEQFSRDVKVNTDLNIAQWRTPIIHISEINRIPLEKFSDIYIWGHSYNEKDRNRKELMNLLYQIEYLNKVESLIMSEYDEYCINNSKIMEEWNSNYMQLFDFIGTCDTQSMSSEEVFIMTNIISKIEPLLNEDGKFSGIDKWENNFVNPMLDLLKPLPLTSHIIKQFAMYIRNMRIIKMKHDKLNQYSTVFDAYIQNLNNAQSIINTSINYFKEQKVKYFCK